MFHILRTLNRQLRDSYKVIVIIVVLIVIEKKIKQEIGEPLCPIIYGVV